MNPSDEYKKLQKHYDKLSDYATKQEKKIIELKVKVRQLQKENKKLLKYVS